MRIVHVGCTLITRLQVKIFLVCLYISTLYIPVYIYISYVEMKKKTYKNKNQGCKSGASFMAWPGRLCAFARACRQNLRCKFSRIAKHPIKIRFHSKLSDVRQKTVYKRSTWTVDHGGTEWSCVSVFFKKKICFTEEIN